MLPITYMMQAMAVFSPGSVFHAKQMLAMDSESRETPSLTPHMLLKADLFFVNFACTLKPHNVTFDLEKKYVPLNI